MRVKRTFFAIVLIAAVAMSVWAADPSAVWSIKEGTNLVKPEVMETPMPRTQLHSGCTDSRTEFQLSRTAELLTEN